MDIENALLAQLPDEEKAYLEGRFQRIELTKNHLVAQRGADLAYLYFPTTALLSVRGRGHVEATLLGADSVVGAHYALGLAASPYEIRVATAGEALALAPAAIDLENPQLARMRELMLRHVYALLQALADAASINASALLIERLAHRLDQEFSRFNRTEIRITHDELAGSLGVRRPGVTLALQALQRSQAIAASRGSIRLLDREKLRRAMPA